MVKVVSVTPEITDPVTSTTAAGYQSIVYTIRAILEHGFRPASPSILTAEFLATNHTIYNAGSMPKCYGGMTFHNLAYPGRAVTDSGCISVPTSAASHLALAMVLVSGSEVWFATS